MRHFLQRVIVGVVLAGVFAGAIGFTLLTGVEDVRDTAMAWEPLGWSWFSSGWTPQTVDLLEAGPLPVYDLRSDYPLSVIHHDELQVLFVTHGADVDVTSGTLDVVGTGCLFEAAATTLSLRALALLGSGDAHVSSTSAAAYVEMERTPCAVRARPRV